MENVLKETCFYETILLETNYIQNKANNAKVVVKGFVRFETGEGMEKKNEDFAAEVAAQMAAAK